MKIMEEQKDGARSLAHNTLGVEGRVGALGWELGRMTSILHMDLHKTKQQIG
jgi:hypothetical protein